MHVSSRTSHVVTPFFRLAVLLLVLVPALAACGAEASVSTTSLEHSCASPRSLVGAGSTFDAPLFMAMFAAYQRITCQRSVTYHANGSGAGMNAFLDQEVDFGATDVPMTASALARSPNGPILHIPVTLGMEAIIYHVAAHTATLSLTGPVLAAIYLGYIRFWDDPALQALNPSASLPHEAIVVVHRSDGSGTTAIFTQYLSAISQQWQRTVGSSVVVDWPTGGGYPGNGAVAEAVETTEGAIGYVELSYALSLHLSYAQLQNTAGTFVLPSIAGAQAAASATRTIPADLRFSVVNATGPQSYPLTSYSWVIVYQHQRDPQKGRDLAAMLWWMIHEGQQQAVPLHYAPLPTAMVSRSETQIRALTCGSQSCFPLS